MEKDMATQTVPTKLTPEMIDSAQNWYVNADTWAWQECWDALLAAAPCPDDELARLSISDRERELLRGILEVELRHAKRCDGIANRSMAEKQKQWDMERVSLLQKILDATEPNLVRVKDVGTL